MTNLGATPGKQETFINSNFAQAVYDRGISFIAATQLICDNCEASAHIELAQQKLKAIASAWDQHKDQLSKDTLAYLEYVLINIIKTHVYNHNKKWEDIKNELDNAENHVNWIQRAPLESAVTSQDGQIQRTETPIADFSLDQTNEWTKIKSNIPAEMRPQWFSALPEWEQNLLVKKLTDWQKQEQTGIANLGRYLGSVPTTVRRYPGAPNAYHTNVSITGGKNSYHFHKIRSGVLVPVKMKADSESQKARKVAITRQNIEQLILEAIKVKLSSIPTNSGTVELPVLLQTLYSPPTQPPGAYNNQAMQQAVEQMRTLLKSQEAFSAFLAKNSITLPQGVTLKINLLFSNRPVNKGRGVAAIYQSLTWISNENNRTTEQFAQILAKKKTQMSKLPEAEKRAIQLAEDALSAFVKIDNTMMVMDSVRLMIKDQPVNYAAERAAFEQIVASQLGVRIGSCVSGKDREEMITEMSIAQIQFYHQYGHFPPPYDPNNLNQSERIAYERMVAHLYLTGHGQKLAAENAKGCDGLKNIVDVFGTRICNQVIALAPQYGITGFDPIRGSQCIAGLNKLDGKEITTAAEKNPDSEFKQNVDLALAQATKKSEARKHMTQLYRKYTVQEGKVIAPNTTQTQTSPTSPGKTRPKQN